MILLKRRTTVAQWLIAAALTASALTPSLATASLDQVRRAGGLEEIVVTAQRREESIRDVPIAMQAFTADTLKQLGVVDTRDLANFVPGFSYAPTGQDVPIYTLRGVGFDDYSRTANSTVGVYVDEAAIPYPYMTQGADVDLQRIEILKGPQGTLYGRNTTGGAINYIAQKPTDSVQAGLEAEYGRFERYSVDGYVSGPFTDRLGGRIALRHIKADEGWQISLTRPEDRLGKEDKQAGRGTLEWGALDNLRMTFTVNWWRDRSEPQAPQPIAIIPQNPDFEREQIHPDVRDHPIVESEDARLADWVPGIPWQLDNEFLMPALRAYWDATDRLSITLIVAYIDFETGKGYLPRSGLSVPNVETIQSTDAWSRSIELRADGRFFKDRLSWLFGLYTSKDFVEDSRLDLIGTNSGSYNVTPGVHPIADRNRIIGEQDAESDAIFANIDYALTDYLNLSLGARYTEEARKLAACTVDVPEDQGVLGFSALFNALSVSQGGSGGAEPGGCFTLDEETRNSSLIHKELEEDNLGGKAAITWTPNEDHLFYVSYSRGFKSGSFPIIPAAVGTAYDPATQERVDAVELGGKTSWFGDRLRIDFAVFDYSYKDKQLLSYFIDDIFGPLPKLFNAPKSSVRGAELEIQSSPLTGLFVSVAASLLDTEITEFVGNTSDGEENVDFSGNELPFASRRSVTLLANYSFPLPLLTGLEGTMGIDYSYVGGARSAIEKDPMFQVPSYELVNVRFSVGDIDGHWKATAWARNATDEFYQLNVSQVAADSRVRYVGMPRTVGITLSYRYF